MHQSLTDGICKQFNPKFLAFDYFEDSINIVIACDCFINQPIPDRVRSVFSFLENTAPELFEVYSVYVHTFTEEELNEIRDNIFDEEL